MIVIFGIPSVRRLIGDDSNSSFLRYGKIAAANATTMNVRISAAPAVNSNCRNSPGPMTMIARKTSVIASTMTLAQMGEWVRSFTSLTLSGRIRSNDHANRLLVAIRNVGGSAAKKASTKLMDMTAMRIALSVSIAVKKK